MKKINTHVILSFIISNAALSVIILYYLAFKEVFIMKVFSVVMAIFAILFALTSYKKIWKFYEDEK